LLDNYHVIEEQIRDIKRDLPREYYRTLPKLRDGEMACYPRVYELALEYVVHTDAVVDKDFLASFISGYQGESVLTIGEIWAIPIMLRLALVDNLRRLASGNIVARERTMLAENIFHEVFDEKSRSSTDLLLVLAERIKEQDKLEPDLASYLIKRMRGRGTRATLALQWLEEKVRESGFDPDEIIRISQHSQAANQISTGNTVTSLKTVSSLNWQDWFEQVSKVERVLRLNPLGVYHKCDFKTRNACRFIIEGLARAVGKSEVDIAKEVLNLASRVRVDREESSHDLEESKQDPVFRKRCHVGFYLLDEGLKDLEAAIGFRAPLSLRLRRHVKRHAFSYYSLAVALTTIVILLGCMFSAASIVDKLLYQVLVILIALVPASASFDQSLSSSQNGL